MIVKDYTHELMINATTGELYMRPLDKEEIFDFIDSKFSDEEPVGKLNALEKAGLTLDDILNFALRKE